MESQKLGGNGRNGGKLMVWEQIRKHRTEKQKEQFLRFQAKGTLTAMLGQVTRLAKMEDFFSPLALVHLSIIKARCKMCLEEMEEKK